MPGEALLRDRHPLEAVVIFVRMVGGGRWRRIRQTEQPGRMRALVHFPQLGDRDVHSRRLQWYSASSAREEPG